MDIGSRHCGSDLAYIFLEGSRRDLFHGGMHSVSGHGTLEAALEF